MGELGDGFPGETDITVATEALFVVSSELLYFPAHRARRGHDLRLHLMAHPAATLTWRAVGDPDRIRDLLDDLPSIGKHRGVGEGLVTHWEVSQTPGVPDWWPATNMRPAFRAAPAPRQLGGGMELSLTVRNASPISAGVKRDC